MATATTLALLTSAASAAPTVTVRAHTLIEIEQVQRTPTGVRVRGWLTEAATGSGIADAPLEIRVGAASAETHTTSAGRFEVDLPVTAGAGPYQLAIHYTGDDLREAAEERQDQFDAGKLTVALALVVPPSMEATAAALRVELTARSESGPAGITAAVLIDDRGAGAQRPAGTIQTGPDGHGELLVSRALLGRPGDKRIVASFQGDGTVNPAATEAALVVTTTTRFVDLTVPAGTVRADGLIEARGRLLDAEAHGVEDALVNLTTSERRVATTLTGRDGSFRLRATASELQPGPVTFVTEYAPTSVFLRGTRSTPFTVTVLEARAVPIGYVIGASAGAACALLAFVLGRARPWVRLARRLHRRRAARGAPAEGGSAVRAGQGPVAGGLTLARPRLMSTLRRAGDQGFAGWVLDALHGSPVEGARLWVEQPHAPSCATTDARGRFELDTLATGDWPGEAGAPGFVTERFRVAIPHRGELRGVRIALVPVRERVFAIYREVAAPVLPAPELWGIWTPRELFRYVRRRQPAGALGALTDLVEETYFSARLADEAVLALARARADSAREELGRAAAAGPPPGRAVEPPASPAVGRPPGPIAGTPSGPTA